MNESRGYRYMIYLLFLLSGVSGLIYQIVWTRMLVLVFGNTMLAMSTVLSAFMGGLAAGSYVLGRYIDAKPRPLVRLYAICEAGIGVFGLLFPLLLAGMTPLYVKLYAAVEGNVVTLNLVRFLVCFALIVIPTFLMGGTLPILIKRFAASRGRLGHHTGFLYGLNTVGAVVGTVACGYILLRVLGMQATTWVAVAINLGVAVVAWVVGNRPAESVSEAETPEVAPAPAPPGRETYGEWTIRMVLIGIGLSGFCALAYEVFWTRMLNLFLHNNIYSFTAILATFLVGIAVGSLFYGQYLSRLKNQLALFAWLQIGIGVISYATPFIFRLLHARLFDNFNESLTLAKTAVIMIGPTIMMGVAVPLAIHICQRGPRREGSSVGGVYAVNTVGAILGAFAAGFILLPFTGLHKGVIIVASMNLVAGFLPLVAGSAGTRRLVSALAGAAAIVVMFVAAPPDLFRGLFQSAHPNADIIHYKEGKVANVLVYDFKKLGYKDFHLNAVNEASSRLWHVQLFKMLGLLPTLVHDDPDDALMVAFGAGMSAGAAARNVTSLDCVDLNPDIQGIAAAYTRENLDVINQPNFNQIVNDGRNALRLNPRTYSLIISDATNPKMFDSWTLYSQEFYRLVKSRLEPGGVFCQWALIPLPADAIKVTLNTFRSVFPHMSVWAIHGSSQFLMLATPERLEIDYAELEERLEPFYEDAGLREFGIDSVAKFLSFFILGEDGAERMLAGYDKVSTDNLPHAQFHIEQDEAGVDATLDLVRFQESILDYMTNLEAAPPEFADEVFAYEEISRLLELGYLTGNENRFREAEVVAFDAGLDDANVAHHLHHCPEKKRHFQKRLATHPDDATAHNSLGNNHLLDGEYDLAREHFEAALELNPEHAFALMNLAKTEAAAGNLDAATRHLLDVRSLSPTRPIILGTAQQLRIVTILRKLQYQPDSAELHRELGVAYYNEGRLLESIRAYRRAVQLAPDDQTIVYNLARICETHGFVVEAAALYTRLAAMRPGDEAIETKRARLTRFAEDRDLFWAQKNTRLIALSEGAPEAEAEAPQHPPTCDRALAVWQDFDEAGMIRPEQLREAAKLYEQSVAAKPDDLHAWADAAELYEGLGEFEKAASLWEGILRIEPDRSIAREQARRLRSLDEIARGGVTGKDQARLLWQAGRQFAVVQRPERAREYLQQALTADPEHAEAWQDLARVDYAAGRYREALQAAERALLLEPGLREAKVVRDSLSAMDLSRGE